MDPLIKEEQEAQEPEEEQKEDPSVKLREELRQEYQQQLNSKEQEMQLRLAQMERDVERRFAQAQPYQGMSTQEAQQAAADLGMSKDEILADPDAALQKIYSHFTNVIQERDQKFGQVLAGVADKTFQSEMRLLKNKDEFPFYEDLKPHIEDYYSSNPREKVPGVGRSPSEVYELLVGRNWKVLDERRKQKEPTAPIAPADEVTRLPSEPEPPTRTPAPEGPRQGRKKKVELSPEEEKVRVSYNRDENTNISPEEWIAIRDNKVLPPNKCGSLREDG